MTHLTLYPEERVYMLAPSSIEKIIPILKSSAKRALRMKIARFPSPYYVSFLLRDIETAYTSASGGSIYEKRADHSRNVYCDIRVGSYKSDQTTNGGLSDASDEELESHNHSTVPIDDANLYGLTTALWRLTEVRFREAVTEYQHKQARRISTVDENRHLPNFVPLKPTKSIQYETAEKVDLNRWSKYCKKVSEWMSELPGIFADIVSFNSEQESKIFVSTENRVVVQHIQIFTLYASFKKLSEEGSNIEQELVLNVRSQKELPDLRQIKKMLWDKYEKLMELSQAKKIHSFSGPVLLYPGPAGLLFHEAIGHRLEGDRLLAQGEGQTFKGQLGKKILNVDVTIRDNPKLKAWKGNKCLGAYDYDDEGVQAKDTLLVEGGVLKGFLSSRSALSKRNFTPNGHSRNARSQRPISRMGVLHISSKRGLSMTELKSLLLKEIEKQKKPFGLIIYETSGGETDTSSYDFQAFSGEISYATLIYPDGTEEVVRGVNLVGTPLQALNNVIAVGDSPELDNSFCGAESGFIPVSTISPAVLIKNLEFQAKEEELCTPHLLPKPRPYALRRKKKKSRRKRPS
jgi:predicted Zn-dependent protease